MVAGTALDEMLPIWHHRERHRTACRAASDVVWCALDEVTWRELRIFRTLLRLASRGRSRPPLDRPFLERLIGPAFTVLHRSEGEFVFGAVVRVRAPSGPLDLDCAAPDVVFRAFGAPGHYKVAVNFRLTCAVLSTETRVLVTDPVTRRRFRRYWWVIRLPGGLIRREWLRAVRRRAERSPLV